MPSTQIAAPSTVNSVDRRAQAIALRRQGYIYRKIGEIMGIGEAGANKLVISALRQRRAELEEGVEELRTLENDRLDMMTRLMTKRLDDPQNPDPEKTVNALLRIMRRRADMNGLDAPKDFRIVPTSGAATPSAELDMSKLSIDDLRELEQLQARYEAIAQRQALQLPAGDAITVVPAPTDGGPNEPARD